MAEDDALFEKGMPIRREVLGAEYVDASMARVDEFMMSFQRATTARARGWAWGEKRRRQHENVGTEAIRGQNPNFRHPEGGWRADSERAESRYR